MPDQTAEQALMAAESIHSATMEQLALQREKMQLVVGRVEALEGRGGGAVAAGLEDRVKALEEAMEALSARMDGVEGEVGAQGMGKGTEKHRRTGG